METITLESNYSNNEQQLNKTHSASLISLNNNYSNNEQQLNKT